MIQVASARFGLAVITALALLLPAAPQVLGDSFAQTNLVSDIQGLAAFTDPNLKNPWGVSFSATSPFWVSDQLTDVSTLYAATGAIRPLIVSVAGGPTGQVFTGAGNFVEPVGATSAIFTFATLGGTIDAWNSANGTTAQVVATTAGASFTGLALANNGSGNFLYAANNSGKGAPISVFNSSFAPVVLPGSFTDPNPKLAEYAPYNIQNINGQLYVEYANFSSGLGAVSVFDANGNFVKELIPPGGKHLHDPWGIVLAPSGFGSFANDLLVANLGNGEINAFDPTTGGFLGTLDGSNGQPIVNNGLWSLSTRTGTTFDPNAVYFTAGINDQKDGLFGSIEATPEPPSLLLLATGLLCLAGAAGRRIFG